MLSLRDIMATGVIKLSPDASLRDAMELLAAQHVGGAPVVAGERVIGVISSTDIMAFLAELPGIPEERIELANRGEPDEEPTTYWSEGNEPLSAFFVDFWSDVGAPTDERMRAAEGPEWNVLEEHTVNEAMNFGVVSLPSSATIDEAAETMRSAGVHRVLVMDDGKLVGIVSTGDVADALSERSDGGEGTPRRSRSAPEGDSRRSEL